MNRLGDNRAPRYDTQKVRHRVPLRTPLSNLLHHDGWAGHTLELLNLRKYRPLHQPEEHYYLALQKPEWSRKILKNKGLYGFERIV